ncbi:MAG: aminotransferase class IV [Thermodesulfobacteriota bacterium]|nr:aminotransferase class IV [Thermodesulfobacteriota bacterium]
MPRLVETAIHKTLNYFFYYRAGQWAKQNNGDEAIIMNHDDTVSETNTANLLLIRGTSAIVPVSPAALSGIMQAQIINCLKARGYEIVYEKTRLDHCLTADSVLATNSLMGAVPVLSINGEKTPVSPVLGHELNREMAVKFDT